jgi:quercetin dioxygenase-like cupin family protein
MDAGNPHTAAFELVDWVEEAPGVRAKPMEVAGSRWAIVEYAPSAGRSEWCHEGHYGFVLEGVIHYELEGGAEPLSIAAGQAFFLPSGQGHRGRNHHPDTTRLFVIDL